MPSVLVGANAPEDHPLTPHMTVQGHRVYANPLDLATIPARALTTSFGVLAEPDQDRIIQALDEMVSRA
jgi:toxin CcdB